MKTKRTGDKNQIISNKSLRKENKAKIEINILEIKLIILMKNIKAA